MDNIRIQEILEGKKCPPALEANLLELIIKINKVRDAFGRPMIITSGFRTKEEHLAIYKDTIAKGGYVPMSSKHLSCQAVDIYDPQGTLYVWCKENEELIRQIGLWLEKRQGVWQHFQTVPFKSYKSGGTVWFDP